MQIDHCDRSAPQSLCLNSTCNDRPSRLVIASEELEIAAPSPDHYFGSPQSEINSDCFPRNLEVMKNQKTSTHRPIAASPKLFFITRVINRWQCWVSLTFGSCNYWPHFPWSVPFKTRKEGAHWDYGGYDEAWIGWIYFPHSSQPLLHSRTRSRIFCRPNVGYPSDKFRAWA